MGSAEQDCDGLVRALYSTNYQVLRYYADLSEAQIASAMAISRGAVKSHTVRGMSALRSVLEQES
ncbi:MAG: sigma factor-like helix-turn-helix DNA-binding protein [Micromonosporaceae bacterium]